MIFSKAFLMEERLFISDLHLSRDQPQILKLFQDFMANRARQAHSLYILGDLFDVWVGDDDPDPPNQEAIKALQSLSCSGTQLFLMHGNRDFLIGNDFAVRTGCKLLSDPYQINLFGTPTLLMHGDLLCTDDVAYQQFRQQARTSAWQSWMLTKPLKERLDLATNYRSKSKAHQETLAENIMDANQATVIEYFQKYQVEQLIHGHTHRPAEHLFLLQGQQKTRRVLPEWTSQGGGVLCWSQGGCHREKVA